MDNLGTAYTDRVVATGLGSYLATPLIREYLNPDKPYMTQFEAESLVEKCMHVMFYRDSHSSANYQLATITTDKNIRIYSDIDIEQDWDLANIV